LCVLLARIPDPAWVSHYHFGLGLLARLRVTLVWPVWFTWWVPLAWHPLLGLCCSINFLCGGVNSPRVCVINGAAPHKWCGFFPERVVCHKAALLYWGPPECSPIKLQVLATTQAPKLVVPPPNSKKRGKNNRTRAGTTINAPPRGENCGDG